MLLISSDLFILLVFIVCLVYFSYFGFIQFYKIVLFLFIYLFILLFGFGFFCCLLFSSIQLLGCLSNCFFIFDLFFVLHMYFRLLLNYLFINFINLFILSFNYLFAFIFPLSNYWFLLGFVMEVSFIFVYCVGFWWQ